MIGMPIWHKKSAFVNFKNIFSWCQEHIDIQIYEKITDSYAYCN